LLPNAASTVIKLLVGTVAAAEDEENGGDGDSKDLGGNIISGAALTA
jgi:hypothetical protein